MKPIAGHILVLCLGIALGFAYARGAAMAPIVIERCSGA